MVFCSYRNRLEPKIENRFAGDWLKKAGNVQINLENRDSPGWMNGDAVQCRVGEFLCCHAA